MDNKHINNLQSTVPEKARDLTSHQKNTDSSTIFKPGRFSFLPDYFLSLLALCFIFLLSGAAGLLFETLWFHGVGLSFGNSVWASSITLAAYMGGLALGNYLAGRFGKQLSSSLRAYIRLELLIACSGALLVWLLPSLGTIIAPLLGTSDNYLWWGTPLRLSLTFLLLMIPTTAMGATLPLMVKALCRNGNDFGRVLGYLYGFNTLGAMFGAIIGEAFLIQALGLKGTGIFAALLDVLAAILCLLLVNGSTLPQETGQEVIAGRSRPPYGWRIWLILFASGLSGAALLGAEVLWFRFLRLFFVDTDATFVVMLAVVLAGIGLGGLLAGFFLSRKPQCHNLAGVLAALCGIALVASYCLFNPLVGGTDWYDDRWAICQLSIWLMFPTALASGVLFTFLGQALQTLTDTTIESVASLATANTTGAMLGSLAGAFVLIPYLGIDKSIWALTLSYGLVFLCLTAALGFPGKIFYRLAWICSALLLAFYLVSFPFGRMQWHLDLSAKKFRNNDNYHTVAVKEGLTDTLQYIQADVHGQALFHILMTNGFSMADSSPGTRRYMSLFAYLPASLRPTLNSALLICYGLGNTAKSLTMLPTLREIQVVDISRDIIAHSNVAYPGAADPLKDPRVSVRIEDGRFFLQATNRKFDLITSEPPPPWAHGVVNLYTEEYFRLIRNRLTDRGMATYWLPAFDMSAGETRSIIKAFCNAFDDCGLWDGYGKIWMLTGSRGGGLPPTLDQFTALWRNAELLPALQEIGLERPEFLGATFMADAAQLKTMLRDTSPLTDNFPKRYYHSFPNAEDNRFYADWMDPQRTRQNFLASEWIARNWPPALRRASEDYFTINQGVNVPEELATKGLVMQQIAETQRYPGLVTPILWLLGTSQREIAIARSQSDVTKNAYILGVDALSRNEIEQAADLFEQALNDGNKSALYPLLFTACQTRQTERARAAATRYGQLNIKNTLVRCW
jgi:spermidine synthase